MKRTNGLEKKKLQIITSQNKHPTLSHANLYPSLTCSLNLISCSRTMTPAQSCSHKKTAFLHVILQHHISWHVLWHSVWHLVWHIFWHTIWRLSDTLLAFYLTDILIFHLTFHQSGIPSTAMVRVQRAVNLFSSPPSGWVCIPVRRPSPCRWRKISTCIAESKPSQEQPGGLKIAPAIWSFFTLHGYDNTRTGSQWIYSCDCIFVGVLQVEAHLFLGWC